MAKGHALFGPPREPVDRWGPQQYVKTMARMMNWARMPTANSARFPNNDPEESAKAPQQGTRVAPTKVEPLCGDWAGFRAATDAIAGCPDGEAGGANHTRTRQAMSRRPAHGQIRVHEGLHCVAVPELETARRFASCPINAKSNLQSASERPAASRHSFRLLS